MAKNRIPAKIDTLGHVALVKWTPERREKFLARLAETGNVRLACELAGISRMHVYRTRRAEADFAEAWDHALEDFADRLEEAAAKRAVEGYQRPMVSGGKLVCHETVYSDRLLERMLEAHRPQKYRRHVKTEVSGPHGGPILVESPYERIARRVARYLSGLDPLEDSVGRDEGGG